MLRLKSSTPLVLLIILVDSQPSLARLLLGQTIKILIFAKGVIGINRAICRWQKLIHLLSKKTKELKWIVAKWSTLATIKRVTMPTYILISRQKTSISIGNLYINNQAYWSVPYSCLYSCLYPWVWSQTPICFLYIVPNITRIKVGPRFY